MADVFGGSGNNSWTNGDTNVRYFGGDGNDSMYGGNGTNVLFPESNPNANGEWIYGGNGNDLYYGSGSNDVLVDYENETGKDTMYGGAGNDTLSSGADNDALYGGSGNDAMGGGTGNDYLDGGTGNDGLYGGAGNDTLLGGEGNDTLSGGAGSDTLTGGTGNDVFIWDRASNDLITDFATDDGNHNDGNKTNNDYVDLSAIFNNQTLAAYNAANGTSFKTPLAALNHDAANGVINFNGTDMSGPTLTMTGVTGGLTYDQTNVACFTTGTMIVTDRGEIAVEDLSAGDLIMTADHGLQPIRWIGSRRLDADALAARPNLRPIRIRAGALGRNIPERDLVVSPQHRILVRSRVAERLCGAYEVLIAAKQLLQLEGVDIDADAPSVEYFHMLFDGHEVITSNGAMSESLYTGPEALKALGPQVQEEIFAIFPELREHDYTPTPARPLPSGRLARKVTVRHVSNRKPLVSA